MQFAVRRFYFHRIQGTFSQSQVVHAHKQKKKKRTSLQSISIVSNTRFLKLVLFLLRKLPARETQLTLIDCYSPEKPTELHNYAHLIPQS